MLVVEVALQLGALKSLTPLCFQQACSSICGFTSAQSQLNLLILGLSLPLACKLSIFLKVLGLAGIPKLAQSGKAILHPPCKYRSTF